MIRGGAVGVSVLGDSFAFTDRQVEGFAPAAALEVGIQRGQEGEGSERATVL